MKFHATELLLPIDDRNKVNIQTKGQTKREISIIIIFYISFAPGVWYVSNNPMEFEPEDWTSKQQALDTTVYIYIMQKRAQD